MHKPIGLLEYSEDIDYFKFTLILQNGEGGLVVKTYAEQLQNPWFDCHTHLSLLVSRLYVHYHYVSS